MTVRRMTDASSVLPPHADAGDAGSGNVGVKSSWNTTKGLLRAVRLISEHFPGDAWQAHVPPGRMERAVALQLERQRRGQQSGLVDCLQFSDKGQILMERSAVRELFGFASRSAVGAVKQLESLRNNLAHAQDIVTHDWAAIARIASRIEEAVLHRRSRSAGRPTPDIPPQGDGR